MTDGQGSQATASSYGLANAWQQARARLDAVEAWLDPVTTRLLEARGVAAGWRCLEIGAGGGSIAAWLCDQVGPSGHVLALDLDTRFLTAIDEPNLEVREADTTRDDIPTGVFDLAHVRLVLMHLGEWGRAKALPRIVAALRPGGWLVAEEMDFPSLAPDPTGDPGAGALLLRLAEAHTDVLAQGGFDPSYGRKLLNDLEAHGLVDLETEGHVRMWRGGSAGANGWRLTLEQLRPRILAGGVVSEEELTTGMALLQAPHFRFMSQVTMAVWGRKPD